jgi:hypothetical protein
MRKASVFVVDTSKAVHRNPKCGERQIGWNDPPGRTGAGCPSSRAAAVVRADIPLAIPEQARDLGYTLVPKAALA